MSTGAMKILPAIDLRDGGVVRLFQGDYNQTQRYDLDPVEVALGFQQAGARFLHVVDLDGAKDGSLANFSTVERITRSTDLSVEIGGGIRDLDRIQRYLDAGVDRVILGTVAVKDPALVDRALAVHGPEHIVIGVDLRDGFVAVQGWLEATELEGIAFCQAMRDKGIQTIICTDIACDGALAGTNLDLYRQLVAIPGLKVIASGGVSTLEDVSALRQIGVDGAIVGKALYEGALDLEQVLAVARGEQE